jgi:hypothetical protein
MEALVYFALKASVLKSAGHMLIHQRALQECTECGVGECTGYDYDCGGYCDELPCGSDDDDYDYDSGVGESVYIGVIVAVVVIELFVSICVYFFAKANAKKRVVFGPLGAMDEGSETCAIIIFGLVFGGLIGVVLYMCAMSCGRNRGFLEGQQELARSGGTQQAPVLVVQGYLVDDNNMKV